MYFVILSATKDLFPFVLDKWVGMLPVVSMTTTVTKAYSACKIPQQMFIKT
jgi:hypothetical protein